MTLSKREAKTLNELLCHGFNYELTNKWNDNPSIIFAFAPCELKKMFKFYRLLRALAQRAHLDPDVQKPRKLMRR